MKKWIFIFVVFFSGLVYVEFEIKSLLTQRVMVTGDKFVTVERGETVSAFVNRLVNEEKLRPSFFYRVMYRRYADLMHIKAGTYQIDDGELFKQLLMKINDGKGFQFSITFIEGESLHQVATKIRRHERIKHELPDDQMASAINKLIGKENAEGWLFPETYNFSAGTSDKAIVQMAHRKMERHLAKLWAQNVNEELTSAYDGLILASIIEKETGLSSERGTIASVFTNRLKKKMRLQTDPTVIYGIGPDFNGDITRANLRTDTPYNTYTRHGLPPTPIAMPGLNSLKAAFAPDETPFYYFVAVGDGSHKFSENYDQHRQAVNEYQRKK